MAYKKNEVVRFTSNQPDVHLQEMFGGTTFNPDDIEPREWVGRVKSVIDDGSAYVVSTLSPANGFICIINADEIIGQVALSDLDEDERRAYNQRPESHEAPNVYDNDPSWLEGAMTLEEKCRAVAARAMAALFPESVVKEYSVSGIYDICKERYIETLDSSLANADTKPKKRRDELKRMRDKLAAECRKMRFKEYYIILAGVEEDAEEDDLQFEKVVHEMLANQFGQEEADKAHDVNPKKVCHRWWVAIDKNFEEVSIMRNIQERSRFFMFLGAEHQKIDHARTQFAYDCLK